LPDGARRASRLATPRWLDLRLVLGVVLVLLAVVVGARVFASAGRYSQVYVARHPLVPGEHLEPSDLAIARIRFDGDGAAYVAVGPRWPTGYLVTRSVDAGELVPRAALSTTAPSGVTSRYVTVPVSPGHLPDALARGDLVDVYATPKVATGTRVRAPTLVLGAVPVDSDDGDSSSLATGSMVAVVLDVPSASVPAVVRAVESGSIDLVGVPAAP
jgi:hypothetical protein